ncbi:hypothetical protein AAVH_25788 [Aphelenchoides avenae]|nr:hypothetical protein AAVH_25788 [Aphelenchus avenae]
MSPEPPFYHDKRYQCCCGINAERAALIIGILGIVWSVLTLSIVSLVAYVCVVIAIKTKNPSLYIVFYVVAAVAVVVYVLLIVLNVMWVANAYDGDDIRTWYIIVLVFAIVELLVQFWVIWIMKRAHAYTKAVRDGGYAHHHHHQDHHFHGQTAAYPAAYPPYSATPNAFTSPQSPPVYTGQAPYPNTIQMNAYPQPQQQPVYPNKM